MKKFCNECGQEFYPRNANIVNCVKCNKKLRDRRYKNKVRHGGKREKIIKKEGLVCFRCGKVGNRFEIVTHHITKIKQVNLCRACHMEIHDITGQRDCVKNFRNISKEMVESALKNRELEEACEVLNITRSALYKLRKRYKLSLRKVQKLIGG